MISGAGFMPAPFFCALETLRKRVYDLGVLGSVLCNSPSSSLPFRLPGYLSPSLRGITMVYNPCGVIAGFAVWREWYNLLKTRDIILGTLFVLMNTIARTPHKFEAIGPLVKLSVNHYPPQIVNPSRGGDTKPQVLSLKLNRTAGLPEKPEQWRIQQ